MKDIVEVAGGRIVPEWLDVDAEKLQGNCKRLYLHVSRLMFL